MLLLKNSDRSLRVLVALVILFASLGLSEEARADKRPFHITIMAGISAGGTLFEAENPNSDYNWTSPEGDSFKGESVQAKLDENIIFGARLGMGLSQQFSVNLSASFTTMNVSADVLTESRNLDTYNYDQMNANFVEAVLVWDWTKEATTPYLLAGIGYSSLSFVERADAQYSLDQSGIEYVLGAGFRWEMLQFEIRDHIIPIDLSPEQQRLGVDDFQGTDPLQVWEISLGFILNFGKAGS